MSRGVAILPIPDNYYDDPATRFDLPAGLLGRMRALGVLYDRVNDGEFFHIPDSIVSPKPVQQPHPPLLSGMRSPAGLRREKTWFP